MSDDDDVRYNDPVPERETPAAVFERCSDERHERFGATSAPRAVGCWDDEPLCGMHLNGRRRSHRLDHDRAEQARVEHAKRSVAYAAVDALADLGIRAEASDGMVLLTPEEVAVLLSRIKR